jgi:hypothetical protein
LRPATTEVIAPAARLRRADSLQPDIPLREGAEPSLPAGESAAAILMNKNSLNSKAVIIFNTFTVSHRRQN